MTLDLTSIVEQAAQTHIGIGTWAFMNSQEKSLAREQLMPIVVATAEIVEPMLRAQIADQIEAEGRTIVHIDTGPDYAAPKRAGYWNAAAIARQDQS